MEESCLIKRKRSGGLRRKTASLVHPITPPNPTESHLGWSTRTLLHCCERALLTINSRFTCRPRHARCGEKKPTCSNCERLNPQCRASEFIAPSVRCAAIESPLGRQRTYHRDSPPVEPPTSTWDVLYPGLPDPSSSDLSETTHAHSQPSVHYPRSLTIRTTEPPTVTLTAEMVFLLHTY